MRSIVYHDADKSASKNQKYKRNPVFGNFVSYDVKDGHLGDITSFENILEIGTVLGKMRWKKFGSGFLDGWLYGIIDDSGQFTGDDIAYIYDDLTTVIYGTFDKGVLTNGRERRIKGFR